MTSPRPGSLNEQQSGWPGLTNCFPHGTGMAGCQYAKGTTRSGRVYAACHPLQCHPFFDLPTLIRNSTALECELLTEATAQPPILNKGLVEETPTTAKKTEDVVASKKRPPGLSFGHWVRKMRKEDHLSTYGQIPRPAVVSKFIIPAVPTKINIDCSTFPATAGAYGAKCTETTGPEIRSLEDVNAYGFTVVQWDGITPTPLLDMDGRVFLVLAGRPNDPQYFDAAIAAYDALAEEGAAAKFHLAEVSHRRGDFPALNVGVTHGMGTGHPIYLNNHPHTDMVDRLLNNSNVQRMAVFASAAFALWAPEVYNYYKKQLDALFQKTNLPRIFSRSIYPAAAFNFGPHVWTRKHRDVKNCPFGWCTIQALGQFNPKTGGHIVFHELRIAVEFPPASTILCPSASITHSNIPVAEGEARASFTQYCSGGLFRYVDYGFRTEVALKAEDHALYDEMCRLRPNRWKAGLSLLSSLDTLRGVKK